MPYLPPSRCPRCALPTFDRQLCGTCLARPLQFDRVLSPCAYAFPLDRLIRKLKFSGYLAAVPLLAELMLPELAQLERMPDVLVAMPLSAERLRERGFNPALEIGRRLAEASGIALLPQACARIRHGTAQSDLPWAQRVRNVRGAFACGTDLRGLAVTVVDDVLTTGATMSEVASVLRAAGASLVVGWVAARTPAPHE
jgi:ComF family protein